MMPGDDASQFPPPSSLSPDESRQLTKSSTESTRRESEEREVRETAAGRYEKKTTRSETIETKTTSSESFAPQGGAVPALSRAVSARNWHEAMPPQVKLETIGAMNAGTNEPSILDADFIMAEVERSPARCRWQVEFRSPDALHRASLEATPNSDGTLALRAKLEGRVAGPAWSNPSVRDFTGPVQLTFDAAAGVTPSAGVDWPRSVPLTPFFEPVPKEGHYISPEPLAAQMAMMGAASASCSSSDPGYSVDGPESVPGLSIYHYKLQLPAGQTATDITWTPEAGFSVILAGGNTLQATVGFLNGIPWLATLKVTFKVGGVPKTAYKCVAIVTVTVDEPNNGHVGAVFGTGEPGTIPFLVNPPTQTPAWVIENDPGSECQKFIYHGTMKAAEDYVAITSGGPPIGDLIRFFTKVTLRAPDERKTALQRIEVGFINQIGTNGSAEYNTNPAGGMRTINIPTTTTLDWLSEPPPPGAQQCPETGWPWYDAVNGKAVGQGNTGTWSTPGNGLRFADSPATAMPAKYNPTDPADPNRNAPITKGTQTYLLMIGMAARTLDGAMMANDRYFRYARASVAVFLDWKNNMGAGWALGDDEWTRNTTPVQVDVDVVPSIINHQAPFLRWIPS